jgi:hypothetical protein
MDPVRVISELKAKFPNVYHKTSFEIIREGQADILVEILDAGEEAGEHRYSCRASLDYGSKGTLTNPEPSVAEALSMVKWQDLDT